jgi:hypothetical protein
MGKPKLEDITSDQDWKDADDNVAFEYLSKYYPKTNHDQFSRIRESVKKKGQADQAMLDQVNQVNQEHQGLAGTILSGYQAMSRSMQEGADALSTSFDPQPNAMGNTPEPTLGQDIMRGATKGLAFMAPTSPIDLATAGVGRVVGGPVSKGVSMIPKVGPAIAESPLARTLGRVGVPSAISAGDAYMQGRSPVMGAAAGAAGGAASELLGAAGRGMYKAGPGGVGRMGERAADRIMDTMEGIIPGARNIPGRTIAEKVYTLGTHEGGRLASSNWKAAGGAADAAIQARGGRLWSGRLSEVYDAVQKTVNTNDPALQRKFVDMYGSGGSATVDQARNLISAYRAINDKGQGQWAIGRKEVANEARDDVYRQIEQLAGRRYADAVKLSDKQYNLSLALVGEKGLFKHPTNPSGDFDMTQITNDLVQNGAKYRKKLGNGVYEELLDDLMPNARPGQRTEVLRGSDEATHTLRRLLTGRGGFAAVPGAVSSIVMPGAANRYRGTDIMPGGKQAIGTGLGAMLGSKVNRQSQEK